MYTAQLYWYSPIRTWESLASFNILTGVGFGGGFILYAIGATLFMAQQVTCLPSLYLSSCRQAACVQAPTSDITHAGPYEDPRRRPAQ